MRGGNIMSMIFQYIGNAFPLCIIELCLATIISNKTLDKRALSSYVIVSIICFIILLIRY